MHTYVPPTEETAYTHITQESRVRVRVRESMSEKESKEYV